jgi:hypothetical protein
MYVMIFMNMGMFISNVIHNNNNVSIHNFLKPTKALYYQVVFTIPYISFGILNNT